MKKFLVFMVLAVASVTIAAAQPRTVGGRAGYSLSASYQHSLGEKNMLNLDLDVPGYLGIGVGATYDWINPFNLNPGKNLTYGTLNWYLGAGAAVGGESKFYYDYDLTLYNRFEAYAGVAGRVGIEFNFEFPLQLSIDWRPVLGAEFANKYAGFYGSGLYNSFSFGVRYCFQNLGKK